MAVVRKGQQSKRKKINKMKKHELDEYIKTLQGSYNTSKVYLAAVARRSQM